MPNVRDLNKPKAEVKPAATVAETGITPTAELDSINPPADAKPVKFDSLKVPAFLQRQTIPDPFASRPASSYIGFASDSSASWPQMQAAGLVVGDMFAYNQGQYKKLDPCIAFLVEGAAYKTVMDASGKFVYATADRTVNGVTVKLPGNRTKPYGEGSGGIEEHYVCYLLVLVDGNLLPIKGDFRGTKSNGISAALAAVAAAGDPNSGWAKLSDAHTLATQFPLPYGRVIHTMRTIPGVGKASGNVYHRMVAYSNPATLQQMELLAQCVTNPAFIALAEDAHKNYKERVAFIEKLIEECKPNVVAEQRQTAPMA